MKTLVFPVLAAVAIACMPASGLAQTGSTPKVGDKAPLVEGKDQDGKTWKLADEIGKNVVLLYFYPKDDTPGCTREACGFRDSMSDLQSKGVKVVGVSFDTADSHKAFIAKHNLNFPLLADTDGKIADAYGARMPDRQMARRVSFLIGKDGRILHVTDAPSADTHLGEMKTAVEKLEKQPAA
ncbi:MAG TPA: peroxiredoxin [Verrucomicrobiota bacterium]|nr:peroxiredoxin [Verrucomicrobiota bacterium]HOP97165.1 peroxiredoxin [Verrucomicrobiota bacterium]HPU55717.1 peroxiredoxin [Verrucomicrobiota bacterium]